MSSQRNLIIFDFETSGLDPSTGAEIVQLAAVCVNAWDFEEHHAGRFEMIFKPQNPEKAEKSAIDVIGQDLWVKANTEGVDLKVGLKAFLDWAEKCNDGGKGYTKPILCGYNVLFDYKFLHFYLDKVKLTGKMDDLPWQDKIVDIWALTWLLFENDFTVNSMTLDTVATQMGIKREKTTHDAGEDVLLTVTILQRYMKFFRECNKRMKVIVEPKIESKNENQPTAAL